MPLVLPEPPEFLKPLIYVLVGERWPQGDENKLFALAGAWDQLAADLEVVDAEVAAAAVLFRGSGVGEAFDAAEEYLAQFTVDVDGEGAVLPRLREAARAFAEMCRKAALQVQYAKLVIVTMAAWPFQQLLYVAYLAVVTAGAGAALASVFRRVAQLTVEQVLRQMLSGVFFQVALDTVVQTIQAIVNDGYDYDEKKLGFAAGVGALGGIEAPAGALGIRPDGGGNTAPGKATGAG